MNEKRGGKGGGGGEQAWLSTESWDAHWETQCIIAHCGGNELAIMGMEMPLEQLLHFEAWQSRGEEKKTCLIYIEIYVDAEFFFIIIGILFGSIVIIIYKLTIYVHISAALLACQRWR